MRVIGGSRRGARLIAPRGATTRPTSDRVRESLFALLGPLHDEQVLDLYAGSGALAIEALSRGARAATLVDRSPAAAAAIRRNLASLRLEAEVRQEPVVAFLRRARAAARLYDLVFLDPPYRQASELGDELSNRLTPVLSSAARVVSESDRRHPLELELPQLDRRQYGDTLISIYGS